MEFASNSAQNFESRFLISSYFLMREDFQIKITITFFLVQKKTEIKK